MEWVAVVGVRTSGDSREAQPKGSNHQPSGSVDYVEVLGMTGEIVPKENNFFSLVLPVYTYTYTYITASLQLEASHDICTSVELSE